MSVIFTDILSKIDLQVIVNLLEQRMKSQVEQYLKGLLSNPEWFAFMVDQTKGTPDGVKDATPERLDFFWELAQSVTEDKQKIDEMVDKVTAALVLHIMGELSASLQSHILVRSVNELVLKLLRGVAIGKQAPGPGDRSV